MPKVDLASVRVRTGSHYAPPLDATSREIRRAKLVEALGFKQFGVNLLTLPPGEWSSHRHWHAAEDEFVFVVAGEVVLVDDDGEHRMRAGDCAGFPGGVANAHQLQNRSDADAVILEIGSKRPEADNITYPDIGMFADAEGMRPLGPTPAAAR